MAYTNEGDIEKYLGVDISGLSAFITTVIAGVTKWIDNYTGKSFEADAEETRYFDGDGSREIIIDSFTGTPSEVKILEVDGDVRNTLDEGHGNDYLAYPLNETEKQRLVLTSNASVGNFPNRIRSVQVKAYFRVATSVPEDITLAATMLAAKIIEKSLKGGPIKSQKVGDLSFTYNNIDEVAEPLGIYNILDQYRDIEI